MKTEWFERLLIPAVVVVSAAMGSLFVLALFIKASTATIGTS
jgi:hypothetical protein